MHRDIQKWYSPTLNKEMEIVEYGHFGPAILLLPTAAADYLEYERFLLIDSIAQYIESGKVKVYSINSINNETYWDESFDLKYKIQKNDLVVFFGNSKEIDALFKSL